MEGQENNSPKNSLAMPIAIVLAGALIAGAVYIKGPTGGEGAANVGGAGAKKEIVVKPVSADDHILGSPTAEVTVIEFSDTECPFCKNFHQTMRTIMDEYGKDGRVAWVYRHMPLVSLHPKAMREAEATECAAEIGGKAKFWDYINRVFEVTPSNNGLDDAKLPEIAKEVGLDVVAFNNCLASGKYKAALEQSIQDGIAAGAEGTPYSVIVDKAGNTYPIPGALPYAETKSIIESILKGE